MIKTLLLSILLASSLVASAQDTTATDTAKFPVGVPIALTVGAAAVYYYIKEAPVAEYGEEYRQVLSVAKGISIVMVSGAIYMTAKEVFKKKKKKTV